LITLCKLRVLPKPGWICGLDSVDPYLGGNETLPAAAVHPVDCAGIQTFLSQNPGFRAVRNHGLPPECTKPSGPNLRFLMVIGEDPTGSPDLPNSGTRILMGQAIVGRGTPVGFSERVNERDVPPDQRLCRFEKRRPSYYRDLQPVHNYVGGSEDPDESDERESYLWLFPVKREDFRCSADPYYVLVSDGASMGGRRHRWVRPFITATAHFTVEGPWWDRQYVNLDGPSEVCPMPPQSGGPGDFQSGRRVCIQSQLLLTADSTATPNKEPYLSPPTPPAPWPGQEVTLGFTDPPWQNGDSAPPTNPAYDGATEDPIPWPPSIACGQTDNHGIPYYSGGPAGLLSLCAVAKKTDADGVASAVFHTSTFGGDNYRWKTCLFPDCQGPTSFSAEGTLTVWRKVWVWVNAMVHAPDHSPRCMIGESEMETPENPLVVTTDWAGETIAGAFDDAFIEVTTPIRRQNTDFVFDLGILDLHDYSRDHTDFPVPHPEHTAQLIGVHGLEGSCIGETLGGTARYVDVHSAVSVQGIWASYGAETSGQGAEFKTAIHELGHNIRWFGENGVVPDSCDPEGFPPEMDVMTQNWLYCPPNQPVSGYFPPRWFNTANLAALRETVHR
jgi:hypothetical protein